MRDEDNIFELYALKRLKDDHNLEHREYLDSSEFDLADSPSLNFLAEQTGVKLSPLKPKWITEASDDEESADYYRDVPERLYVITTEDILQNRFDNMQQILEKLSKPLASKIKAFEKDTKYLYARALSSSAEITSGLKNILKKLEHENAPKIILQRLVINHAENIVPARSLKKQKAINASKKKAVQTQEGEERFYALIKAIYNPKNKDKRIELYKDLFKVLPYRNMSDLYHFMGDEKYRRLCMRIKVKYAREHPSQKHNPEQLEKHVNKVLLMLTTTELKRDIYKQLYLLYKANGKHEEGLNAQDLEEYNKSCSHFSGRLLGDKGAFEMGGIYGPDSPFSGLIQNKKGPYIPPSAAGLALIDEEEPEKKENFVQLKLFPNSSCEY